MRESLHTARSEEEPNGTVKFRAVIRGVPGVSIPVPVGAAAATDAPATGFAPSAGAVSSFSTRNEALLAAPAVKASLATPWTRADLLRAAALVVFLLSQVGIPLHSYLAGDSGDRFAWRMHSTLATQPAHVVELRDGTRDTVAAEDYAIDAPPGLDWSDRYSAHLCAIVPGAVATWRGETRSSPETRLACRR